MDLAYVDKLAKVINGVEFLFFRQDLFDRTVDAKKNEKKRLEGSSQDIFESDYQKNHPKNWIDQGTHFAGESEIFEALKEWKFTLYWVRRRQHLQNVQYAHPETISIAT